MRWGSANSELWREAEYRQIRNLDIEVGVVISNVLQGGEVLRMSVFGHQRFSLSCFLSQRFSIKGGD